MFLKTLVGCAVAAVGVLMPAVTLAGAEPPSDLVMLQGTWRLVGLEEEKGKPVPAAELEKKASRIEFVGTRFIELESANPDHAHVGTFTLNPAKTPKEIDFTYLTGGSPKDKRTARAIYRLEGDNTLVVCLVPAEKPGLKRPTMFQGFDLATGQGGILATFHREKQLLGDFPTQKEVMGDRRLA